MGKYVLARSTLMLKWRGDRVRASTSACISRRASSRMVSVMPANCSLWGTWGDCAAPHRGIARRAEKRYFIQSEKMCLLVQLADHHNAVADRKQDVFNPWIIRYLLIKGHDRASVFVRLLVEHLSAPQHIIRQDNSTQIYFIYDHVIVIAVIFFIGVDEDEVKLHVQRWNDLRGVADAIVDALAHPGCFKVASDTRFQFFVLVDRNQRPIGGHALDHA